MENFDIHRTEDTRHDNDELAEGEEAVVEADKHIYLDWVES